MFSFELKFEGGQKIARLIVINKIFLSTSFHKKTDPKKRLYGNTLLFIISYSRKGSTVHFESHLLESFPKVKPQSKEINEVFFSMCLCCL